MRFHHKVKYKSGVRFGSRIIDSRTIEVSCPLYKAFEPIECIGGKQGWYYGNWLWKIRGWLDLLAGGAGMKRGRRHPTCLRPGDTVDFWRVEEIQSNQLLRLYSQMKLPGRAWLQFEIKQNNSNITIRQTAIFDPVGILGLVYWYLLYPIHVLVFKGMLNGIARRAEKN